MRAALEGVSDVFKELVVVAVYFIKYEKNDIHFCRVNDGLGTRARVHTTSLKSGTEDPELCVEMKYMYTVHRVLELECSCAVPVPWSATGMTHTSRLRIAGATVELASQPYPPGLVAVGGQCGDLSQ